VSPTIGQMVLFYAWKGAEDGASPAIITKVHSDRLVTLAVIDDEADEGDELWIKKSVRLVPPGEEEPDDGNDYATWMAKAGGE